MSDTPTPADRAALRALLRRLEWGGELPSDSVTYPLPTRYCLICYCNTQEGHAPDCALAALLGAADATGEDGGESEGG